MLCINVCFLIFILYKFEFICLQAESPKRKPEFKARAPDTGNRFPEISGRQLEPPGGGGGRSTDSPASTSSTENDEGRATRQIEIFQTNEEGKSVCGICSKVNYFIKLEGRVGGIGARVKT